MTRTSTILMLVAFLIIALAIAIFAPIDEKFVALVLVVFPIAPLVYGMMPDANLTQNERKARP